MRAGREATGQVLDFIKLAIGVAFFAWFKPALQAALPGHTLAIQGIDVIASAIVAVIIWWLVTPVSTVRVQLVSIATSAAVPPGPMPIELKPDTPPTELFDMKVSWSALGLFGRLLARAYVSRDATLELSGAEGIEVIREGGAGMQVGGELHVPLPELVSSGVWFSSTIGFRADSVAPTPEDRELRYRIHYGKPAFLASIFFRVAPATKALRVIRKAA